MDAKTRNCAKIIDIDGQEIKNFFGNKKYYNYFCSKSLKRKLLSYPFISIALNYKGFKDILKKLKIRIMIEFLIILVIAGICGLIFGKADTKSDLLHVVGLDLSEENYMKKKVKEFEKYCIKAMEEAINRDDYDADSEIKLLDFLNKILYYALYGRLVGDNWDTYYRENPISLEVRNHYIKFARTVVRRRKEAIKNGDSSLLIPKNSDFTNKKIAKKYVNLLFEKYQDPWPSDWLQRDSSA